MITVLSTPSPEALAALDAAWLDEEGRLRLLPAAAFTSVDPDVFKVWCHHRARYVIPTVELIDFLRERIGNRKTVEIGAGNADLGHHLGITMTDSRIQQLNPEVRFSVILRGGMPTAPPPTVLTMDAKAAIRRFRPKVVVGAWVTRKFRIGVDRPGSDAFVFGADDEHTIARTQMYIHVGADHIHGTKTALSLPHEEVRLPGLISRVSDQSTNVIYIWGK
jgi:hypothetical protein